MSFKKTKMSNEVPPLKLDHHGYITLTSFKSLMITKCFEKHLSDVVLRYLGMTDCFKIFDRYSMDDYWEKDIRAAGLKHSFHGKPIFFNSFAIYGTKWYKLGGLHRDGNLYAYIAYYRERIFSKQYWKNGRRHRDNGLPAIVHCDERDEYWVKGKHVKTQLRYIP